MRIMQRIDDVDYAADKTETTATHTVKLTWQVDGGPVQAAELDLSDEHLAEYGQHMFVLLHAYQVNNPEPASKPALTVVGEARKYGQAVRKFADEYNIRALDGPDRPAYVTPNGGWYPPRWLKKAYDHWAATGEVVLPGKQGQASDEKLHGDRAAR